MEQPGPTGNCNFAGLLTYLLKENTMKRYLVLLLSAAALLAGNAIAQYTMKKDEMGKGGAMGASGSMAKESMGKDEMKKDQMSKSYTKKPEKKGGMSKDDAMGKDSMGKDATKQ